MSNENGSKKMSLKSFDKALLVSIIVLVVANVIGLIKLSTLDDPMPGELSFIAKTFTFTKIVYVIGLIIFIYTIYVRSKKGRNFKILSNIMPLIGFILYGLNFLIGAPIYRAVDELAKTYKNLMNMNFGGVLSGEMATYGHLNSMSGSTEALVGFLFFASPIVMVIAAIILYRKIYKHVDMTVGEETVISKSKIQDGFNKTKNNITNKVSEVGSQISADNIDDYDVDESDSVEDTFEEVKEKAKNNYEDYDDDYDDDINYNEREKVDSSKILKIGGIVLGIIVLIFLIKFIVDKTKPDAVVDTSGISINVYVEGVDGYGRASAEFVGDFDLQDVSSNIDRYELLDYLGSTPIELDKKENIKNGDKITATAKFDKGDYKIKFTEDELKEEVSVEDLPDLINSIKDIPNEVLDKIDKKIKKHIQEYAGSYAKNLNIKRVRIYEEVADKEDLNKMTSEDSQIFNIMPIYQVEYDTIYEDHSANLLMYKVENFSENNGAYVYDITSNGSYDIIDIEDMDNNLKYAGYNEVSDFREEIKVTAPVEEAEEETEEAEETVESDNKMVKLSNNLLGTSRTVKERGNLRMEPGLDSDVIVQLGDNAVVDIYDTVIKGDRVWCHVSATDTDGYVYDGWISNRVLDI